jgi:hypothetical protein
LNPGTPLSSPLESTFLCASKTFFFFILLSCKNLEGPESPRTHYFTTRLKKHSVCKRKHECAKFPRMEIADGQAELERPWRSWQSSGYIPRDQVANPETHKHTPWHDHNTQAHAKARSHTWNPKARNTHKTFTPLIPSSILTRWELLLSVVYLYLNRPRNASLGITVENQ